MTDNRLNKTTNLKRLLAPKHLAFVGGRSMAKAVRRCLEGGFKGTVSLVNPKHDSIDGVKCYPSISALEQVPDAAFVATNREQTLVTVAELSAQGAGGAVCYASGFAEAGADGEALQQQLLAAAGDMAILGPNCYGLLDYLHGAALWPVAHGGQMVDKGVSILTQSGNFAYNLSMTDRSLPVAYMASVGNQAQIGVAELIEEMLNDSRITAIGVHLEGLNDVPAFARAAYKALQKQVPIVVLKTGTSEIGAELALSHTSSLAGSDELYNALFERLGVIRVSGPVSFMETLKAAAGGRLPTGNKLAALACSGGDAGLIADYAEQNNLQLPRLQETQKKRLAAVLPDFASLANPLDFTTAVWGNREALTELFDEMLLTQADAALLVLDYPREDTGERPECDLILEVFCEALQRHDKLGFVASAFPDLLPTEARELLQANGVAGLQGVEDGLAAWGRLAHYSQHRQELLARGEAQLPLLPATVLESAGQLLDEWASKQALKPFGLPIPKGLVSSPATLFQDAEQLGYPLVLKVLSAELPHKTEAGAVALNITSPADLQRAATQIQANLHKTHPHIAFERLLLESMGDKPVAELLVGVTRSPGFGLALVIGAGGILVELLRDSQTLLLPTNSAAIEAALAKLKSAVLLDGFRGQAKVDMQQLVKAIEAVAQFACDNAEQLLELDVNPLLVGSQQTLAVDALVRLAQ